MTLIISDMWPRHVLPLIRKEWFQAMTGLLAPVAGLYGIETSTSSVEYSQGIGGFGLVPEYNSDAAEGAPAAIEYDRFSPLYEKTFTHKEYAKQVAVERKLVDDDRIGLIRRRAASLGYAFGSTIATHQASVFVNAFSSSYLGGDGKALCASDHPRNTADSTSISNTGTSALSYAAVTATMQAGKALTDDRGTPFPSLYRVLVVPTELEAKAYEITNAINKPGGADNDANYTRGLTVMVDPYLTDANNWFLVDPDQSKLHLLWFWRVRPEIDLDPSSNYRLVAQYRGYMRYSFGWDDFRWVYGHNVT